jgi:hypothetical protein
MAAAALASGFVYSFIMSYRVRSTKRFFIRDGADPVRRRRGQTLSTATSERESRSRRVQSYPIPLGAGKRRRDRVDPRGNGFGHCVRMGYIGYGVVILGRAWGAVLSSQLRTVFRAQKKRGRSAPAHHHPRIARIQRRIRRHFRPLSQNVENAGTKTTGMGSMFAFSYKVRLKDPTDEKALIDELRTRNGNLEDRASAVYRDAQSQL